MSDEQEGRAVPDSSMVLSDPAALDLGLLAAKLLSEKLGAQVLDYNAAVGRTSIRLQIPSRAKRLNMTLEKSRQLVAQAGRLHAAARTATARSHEHARTISKLTG